MSCLLELSRYVVQFPWINLADELGLSRGQFNTNLLGFPCRVLKQTHTEIAWSKAVPINRLISV